MKTYFVVQQWLGSKSFWDDLAHHDAQAQAESMAALYHQRSSATSFRVIERHEREIRRFGK